MPGGITVINRENEIDLLNLINFKLNTGLCLTLQHFTSF